MTVKVRQIDDAEGSFFTSIEFYELDGLISFIKSSSGFYIPGIGQEPFHSYQLILDDNEAYCEIIVGEQE